MNYLRRLGDDVRRRRSQSLFLSDANQIRKGNGKKRKKKVG